MIKIRPPGHIYLSYKNIIGQRCSCYACDRGVSWGSVSAHRLYVHAHEMFARVA